MTTAIPLRQGVEPQLNSLVDPSNGIVDYDTPPENNDNFMEECRNDAETEAANMKPGIFVTGPESWPANLQLKVRKQVVS